MTADERIENLLQAFGQTISDLPTANDYKRRHDQIPHLIAAMDAAEAWYDPESNEKIAYSMMAYICHLVEIIDRMETALEIARRTMSCDACRYYIDCKMKRDECESFELIDLALIDHALINLALTGGEITVAEQKEEA